MSFTVHVKVVVDENAITKNKRNKSLLYFDAIITTEKCSCTDFNCNNGVIK